MVCLSGILRHKGLFTYVYEHLFSKWRRHIPTFERIPSRLRVKYYESHHNVFRIPVPFVNLQNHLDQAIVNFRQQSLYVHVFKNR